MDAIPITSGSGARLEGGIMPWSFMTGAQQDHQPGTLAPILNFNQGTMFQYSPVDAKIMGNTRTSNLIVEETSRSVKIELDDLKTVQEAITETLAINLTLLANMLNVERKTLYNHRTTLPRDLSGYQDLLNLTKDIRKIVPHGLEAGTRVIFKDGECLKDHIKSNPTNIQSIKDFALYVAQEWQRKHG